jgi:SH3-like domain-containing protein
MRIGPERRFRSSWLFVRKHYPIEIIDEHRYWRKVKDVDGTTGWMHKTLLSGRRTALTLPPRTPLYKEITPDMPVVAIITANNIVFLEDCRSQSGYCSVQIKDYTGWIAKSALWGLNADEQK